MKHIFEEAEKFRERVFEELDGDYWLFLYDRLVAIKDTVNKYGIDNFYLAFSGGKDSTVLHHLLDIAIPNNKIPRVFSNTGVEYMLIQCFVYDLAAEDDRFVIIKPSVPIRKMLEEKGYPFKSKEHSLRVNQFNIGSNAKFIKKYTWQTDYRGKYLCPKSLLYQFKNRGEYNYSNKCCYELKKKPMHKYEKDFKKSINITGMRSEEGGNRSHLGCISTKNGKVKSFHPLIHASEEWIDWFIKVYDIKLCDLYYPPYNFKRTGCRGCPYALDLAEQLKIMELYLPSERAMCEVLWKPVYDEYRRIHYRLTNTEQLKLL